MADSKDVVEQNSDKEIADTAVTITLNNENQLDLTGLDTTEIAELKRQYASGMIDVKKRAEELKVDVGALDAALGSFNDQTARSTRDGSSTTITHTQSTSFGRTEVVMGNTDKAAAGKVSRSAAGEDNKTLWIIGIVAVAAIVVAAIAFGGK
jgi:hypothetical protein